MVQQNLTWDFQNVQKGRKSLNAKYRFPCSLCCLCMQECLIVFVEVVPEWCMDKYGYCPSHAAGFFAQGANKLNSRSCHYIGKNTKMGS